MIKEKGKFLYDGDEPSIRRIGVVWSFVLLTISLFMQYFTGISVASEVINSLVGLTIVALGSTTIKKKDNSKKESIYE